MSELEHALRAALADPPAEIPDEVGDPLWDIEIRIRRRRRRQRRGALAALACAAVAAVVVPISVYGTPDGARTASDSAGQAASQRGAAAVLAVPSAVRQAAEQVASAPGSHVSGPVRWVRTTSDRLWTFEPFTTSKPKNVAIYVIQLRGRFRCANCLSPVGGTVSVRTVIVPVSGPGLRTQSDRDYDLGKLGVVHTFQLR